jgi:hypothetical protein
MVHGQFSSFIALPVIVCTRGEFAIHWGFSGFNMFSEAIRTYVIWNSNKALPWFLDYKFGRSISWSSLSNMWGSAFYSCAKKTLAWPHHFIKSECLGPYNKFNPAPFYCSSVLWRDSARICICVNVDVLASVSTILPLDFTTVLTAWYLLLVWFINSLVLSTLTDPGFTVHYIPLSPTEVSTLSLYNNEWQRH